MTQVEAELTHDESTISDCRCSQTVSKRRSTSMSFSATKRRLSNDCVLSRMRSLRCVSSRDEASQDSKLQHGVMKNQVADPRARHEQAVERAQECGPEG